MLKYVLPPLSDAAITRLAELQARVDALPTQAEQYELANRLFGNKSNATFDEIKAVLATKAPAGEACYYCERDRYRDIEHIRPKRHYPGQCFQWQNYVYACAICNQDRKKDTFAVLDSDGNLIEFDRNWNITTRLPQGQQVLIDLRTENPLDFLQLDLENGIFTPIGDTISQKRGKWTRDLFELNNPALARVRAHTYVAIKHYLDLAQQAMNANDSVKVARVLEEIRLLPHPTVLAEMRRQNPQIPELAHLFANIPADIGKLT